MKSDNNVKYDGITESDSSNAESDSSNAESDSSNAESDSKMEFDNISVEHENYYSILGLDKQSYIQGGNKEEKGSDKEEKGSDKEEEGSDKEEEGSDKEEEGSDKEEEGSDTKKTRNWKRLASDARNSFIKGLGRQNHSNDPIEREELSRLREDALAVLTSPCKASLYTIMIEYNDHRIQALLLQISEEQMSQMEVNLRNTMNDKFQINIDEELDQLEIEGPIRNEAMQIIYKHYGDRKDFLLASGLIDEDAYKNTGYSLVGKIDDVMENGSILSKILTTIALATFFLPVGFSYILHRYKKSKLPKEEECEYVEHNESHSIDSNIPAEVANKVKEGPKQTKAQDTQYAEDTQDYFASKERERQIEKSSIANAI